MASFEELRTSAYQGVEQVRSVGKTELSDRLSIARDLMEHCAKSLKHTKEKSRRGRLHYEIARLCEVELSDLDEAVNHYRKSHALDPGYEPAVAGLIRVRSKAGQWEGTLPLFDEQVALTAAPEGKAGLLFTKAVILETRLGREADARVDYERALKLVPNESSLLRAVVRCARREDDFQSLDRLLASQSDVSGEDRDFSAAYMAERARVSEQYRGKPTEAAQFYRKSFELDPRASAAVVVLERLYASQDNPREQVAILSKRAELVQNPGSKASALATAGSLLAGSLGEAAEAAQYFERAWVAQPNNLLFLRELEELYRKSGDFEGVVQVLQRLEQHSQDERQRASLCVSIADIYNRRLGQRQEAIKFWERARELSPALSSCIEPLMGVYEEAQDWSRLAQLLSDEQLASKDIARRGAIYSRLATLAEQKLSNSDAAIEYYRAALGLIPTDECASRELSRLLEEASRFEELVEIHQRAADAALDNPVAFVHLFKVGQVLEDLIKQPVRALPIYRLILDKEPGHLGALFAFQRAAERAGEYGPLVDALVEEASVVKGMARKVPLLYRAAQVCEKSLAQEQRAVKLYTEALTLDPSHGPTLDSFAAIHEGSGRYPELLKVLTLKLSSLSDAPSRAAQLFRMGRLCEEHLRQDDEALGYYKQSLETLADAPEVFLGIDRCLTRLGRFADLAAFLQERVSKQEQGAARAEVAVSLGRVYEMRLGKMSEALAAYEIALGDVPDFELALDARVRVLERKNDPVKAAEAHAGRAAASTDSSVRLWSRLREAEIYENTSRSPDKAIELYEKVLSEHPHHAAALSGLERLYESKGDLVGLTRVLRVQTASLSARHNQQGAYRELLRLSEISLDERAETSSVRAPGQLPEIAAALLERDPRDRAALRFAELAALGEQSREMLARVDEGLARITDQGQLASAHQTRLGEHLEAKNPESALAQHRPALQMDQENIGAARGVTRVAEFVSEPLLLGEAAELEAQVVGDPARSASLLIRGAALMVQSGDKGAAAGSLKRALILHPDSLQAGAALYTLLSESGQHEELGAALSTAAQACRTPEARIHHWIAVAKILADHNGDLPAAISALRRIETSGLKSLSCSLELATLLLRDRQWNPAVEHLQNALKLSPQDKLLLSIRLTLAEIYHEQLGKLSEASRELSAVLEGNPRHIPALRRLLDIQMKEKSKGALKTAQALVEIADGTERAFAYVALGKLYSTPAKQSEAKQPLAAAIEVLGMEPPDAADALRAILIKEAGGPNTWQLYTSALMSFCENSEPGEAQAKVYVELGRTVAQRQQNAPDAIEVLSRGLRKNPQSHSLQRELLVLLKGRGLHREALPHLMALLESTPFEAGLWSELAELHAALGQSFEATAALGPLVLLNGASDAQKSTWSSRIPRAALLSEGAFTADALERTLGTKNPSDAIALLGQLTGPLSKVFPKEASHYGSSAREKVGPRGSHPCRAVLDRLCQCFGNIEVDLYPSDTATSIEVLFSDPVGLIVPNSLTGASEAEQVFALGRFVTNIAREAQVVDILSANDLRVALAASVAMIDGTPSDSSIDSAELSLVTKRLTKAMPWLSKGRIEEAARRYALDPPNDVEEFRKNLHLSSFRAALVLADDVTPVFKLTQGLAPIVGLAPDEIEGLASRLLPYWASPESAALRRQIGLI